MAVVVITAVAALSFIFGYKVGRSGLEGNERAGQVQVVPEGAGLVLLGGNNACEEPGTLRNSPATVDRTDSPSGAILETIKAASLPEPDSPAGGAGPDEPVLEPLGQKRPPVSGQKSEEARRVAPIGQLPVKQDEPTAVKQAPVPASMKPEPATPEPRKVIPAPKETVKAKKPVAPAKKTIAQKKQVPPRKPSVSSDGRAYSVQIGAFKSLSDARTHRVRFTKKGYKASVYNDRGADGSDIFKVRVGIFTSRQDAEKMALRLKKSEGVNGFVTSIH